MTTPLTEMTKSKAMQDFVDIEKLLMNHNDAITVDVKTVFASIIQRKVKNMTRH